MVLQSELESVCLTGRGFVFRLLASAIIIQYWIGRYEMKLLPDVIVAFKVSEWR